MTTQANNTQRMKADIASILDWIECELDKRDDEIALASAEGTIGRVRENLIETLAFFSGVKPKEIQRSLDELHM